LRGDNINNILLVKLKMFNLFSIQTLLGVLTMILCVKMFNLKLTIPLLSSMQTLFVENISIFSFVELKIVNLFSMQT
jgi:hypothetical protein